MRLQEIVEYLDGYLNVRDMADEPNALNGLQVESAGEVRRLAAAVDACQATIEAAAAQHADLLIVHHGLFWRGLEPLTGRTFRRVETLLRHGVAVYASHIPLDRHPEVGNNAVLARRLHIEVAGRFGDYRGEPLGVWGEREIGRDALTEAVGSVLGARPLLVPGGPDRCRRIGIVTGAASAFVRHAADAGLDTLITGEGHHWAFFDAEELGVNVVYAGHYATETLGVQALAAHLSQHFQLPWLFIDHPTGL